MTNNSDNSRTVDDIQFNKLNADAGRFTSVRVLDERRCDGNSLSARGKGERIVTVSNRFIMIFADTNIRMTDSLHSAISHGAGNMADNGGAGSNSGRSKGRHTACGIKVATIIRCPFSGSRGIAVIGIGNGHFLLGDNISRRRGSRARVRGDGNANVSSDRRHGNSRVVSDRSVILEGSSSVNSRAIPRNSLGSSKTAIIILAACRGL